MRKPKVKPTYTPELKTFRARYSMIEQQKRYTADNPNIKASFFILVLTQLILYKDFEGQRSFITKNNCLRYHEFGVDSRDRIYE